VVAAKIATAKTAIAAVIGIREVVFTCRESFLVREQTAGNSVCRV
jgi:hypothetical protein